MKVLVVALMSDALLSNPVSPQPGHRGSGSASRPLTGRVHRALRGTRAAGR
jgi:hypothetical protein